MSGPQLVVGLDLSLTATGICRGRNAEPTLSVVRPRARGDVRLAEIRDAVYAECEGADLAVIEDLPTHAHGAGVTGMVHGAVRVVLLDLEVPFATVPPATLKKYATGRGNADKTAMAVSAYKRSGREFSDDNQCDAYWLYVMGQEALGRPTTHMPVVQTDQLGKVVWPFARIITVEAL
jgi:hypothetical protein